MQLALKISGFCKAPLAGKRVCNIEVILSGVQESKFQQITVHVKLFYDWFHFSLIKKNVLFSNEYHNKIKLPYYKENDDT